MKAGMYGVLSTVRSYFIMKYTLTVNRNNVIIQGDAMVKTARTM